MSVTKSFYLPDDVVEAIGQAGNGSAYITDLVRRDAHRREVRALQADTGQDESGRDAARAWAAAKARAMRQRPADHAELRAAMGIIKAA